jgi:phosphatidylglycerophosphatase A
LTRKVNDQLSRLIATWFFVGEIPFAPGTMGTLAAIPLYVLVARVPLGWYLGLVGALAVLGLVVSERVAAVDGDKDPPWVVVDEVVGFLVSMISIPAKPTWILLGFCCFRLFDILKPPPIRRLEPLKGGIMWDDMVAGIYANLAMRFILRLFSGP